jgi:hypothetical protein
MALFFSLIGLMIAFLMWPIVLIFYFAGFEILYWNYIPWLYISIAAILYLTANILSNFGLCWTYEVFLTLGLLFAIPATAGKRLEHNLNFQFSIFFLLFSSN